MLNVGERFDFALKELKITNKEIAESFNISSQNVSNLKKNDRLNDLISQIATKYNINLNWLVTGKGNYTISNENINNFQNSKNSLAQAFGGNNTNNYNENRKYDNIEIDENILKLIELIYNYAQKNHKIDELKTDLSSLLPKYI
ncbi:helix-turn-helix domain containing protein [Aliarcobacter cryaerophilus]|uniref:helix-turn-helix domain containing protein n=1 Tax=Aliarcobacter cryaerophilus TaxID=28198 RepID=UPI0021B536D2|nr:helix-turn-helix domain containing protein [Aliarcobacter cryaerophilus]MCT7489424.1 helix-turn-helix domain containing protein [Aliarcobacter cryaerophilus]